MRLWIDAPAVLARLWPAIDATADGQTASFTSQFAPIPLSATLSVNWKVGFYESHRMSVHPLASQYAQELSVAALSLKPALDAASADTPVLADGFSCRTQIEAISGRRAKHLAEVLAERLPPA